MQRMLALSLLLCLSTPLHAQHAVITQEERPQATSDTLRPGDRLDVFFFRDADMRLVVIDEAYPRRYGSLKRALEKHGCLAGINGGYFKGDAQASPLGLLVHDGNMSHPAASGSFAVSGVLCDDGKRIRLVRSNKLDTPPTRLREAIQAGPFLVEDGKLVSGLDKRKRARRSFIATDGRGRWCIGVCSPMSLHELALRLSGGALRGFVVRTALNLDGGSSSAFADRQTSYSISNLKPVRNYIGIAPRRAGVSPRASSAENTRPAK